VKVHDRGNDCVHDFYNDHLGSRRAVTDASGTVQAKLEYSVWGVPSVTNYGGYEGSGDVSYTGKERDQTGLYYFNARYYDASLGRFITEDPARNGMNWFVYCNNNPLSRTDPTELRYAASADGNDTKEEIEIALRHESEVRHRAYVREENAQRLENNRPSLTNQPAIRGIGTSSLSFQVFANVPISFPLAIPIGVDSCDIRANNNAYNNGYNMISQDNELIDFSNMLVDQIYNACFPTNRTYTPASDGGLAFWGPTQYGPKVHVEFYTYTQGTATYNIYRNDGQNDMGIRQYSALNPSGCYTFVPLPLLP